MYYTETYCFSVYPAAIATSSGLAAQSTILQILKAGDHVVSMADVYGGMSRMTGNYSHAFDPLDPIATCIYNTEISNDRYSQAI